MTERQIRYRLRKQNLLFRKRRDGLMILGGEWNLVVAGGSPFAYCLLFDEVVEWADDLAVRRT